MKYYQDLRISALPKGGYVVREDTWRNPGDMALDLCAVSSIDEALAFIKQNLYRPVTGD